MEYDVVVRNGVVVDGSGAPRYRADVAIKDRKIAALIDPADAASASGAREIDATGLAIAPGFIDLHSHSDWVLPIADHGQILKPFLLQGVTTFVGGNCGFSVAPVMRARQRMLDESGRLCAERTFEWAWDDVAGFAAHLKCQGLALNVAHLAGHGSIRLSVMGSDASDPSVDQLRAMQAMVERAMADGAVGLSCGLGYFPGMIAKPAELGALARVAEKHQLTLLAGRTWLQQASPVTLGLKVAGWLETAASVPGFIGFAVGRTTFWGPVADYLAHRASREDAVSRIARRYLEWAAIYERGQP